MQNNHKEMLEEKLGIAKASRIHLLNACSKVNDNSFKRYFSQHKSRGLAFAVTKALLLA